MGVKLAVLEHTKYEGDSAGRGPSRGLLSKVSISRAMREGFLSGDDFHAVGTSTGWIGEEGLWYGLFLTGGATPVTMDRVAPADGVVPIGEMKFSHSADGHESYFTLDSAKTDGLGVLSLDKNLLVFETRVKFSNVNAGATGTHKMVGLGAPGGAATGTIGASELASRPFVGFRALAASGNRLDIVVASTGGANAVFTDVGTLVADKYVKLGVMFTGKVCKFFVDGRQVGADVKTSVANFPLNKVVVPIIGMRTVGAVNSTLTVDWIACGRVEL